MSIQALSLCDVASDCWDSGGGIDITRTLYSVIRYTFMYFASLVEQLI